MDNSIGANTMDTQGQEGRNRAAVGYMLLAVVLGSLIPTLFVWGNAQTNPFLFNAGWRFGVAIGCLGFLVAFHSSLIFDKKVMGIIARRVPNWAMLFAVIGNLDFTMFTWSLRFIDVSISAVLIEIWPIFLIFLVARLLGERYKKITIEMVGLSFLCFIGVAFVVNSQFGTGVSENNTSTPMLVIGTVLALGGAIVAALTAFIFKWGALVGNEVSNVVDKNKSLISLELFCVVIAYFIGSLISIPINGLAGFVSSESTTLSSLGIGILGGIFVQSSASILLRKANLVTHNLGVNSMIYMAPIMALLWLFLASQVNVARIDFLLIGAGAIITANLLINFEAELRLGFKSLIISLWVCGVWVYLRPVEGALFGIQDWAVGSAEAYFSVLTLAATVFTLILSFRVGRLVSRTRDEEDKTFALFQKLDTLVERGILSADVRKQMLVIDVSERRPNSLRSAYASTRKCISDAKANSDDDAHKSQLSEAEAELNALVHSKQQGIVFGELAALYIVAIITVFIALSSRPALASDWNNFLVEAFAVLLSAVIIFLIFNAHDLQNERVSGILKKIKNGGYGVMFRDAQIRAFEQWLSIAISIVLAVGFGALLLDKWQIWNWLAAVN